MHRHSLRLSVLTYQLNMHTDAFVFTIWHAFQRIYFNELKQYRVNRESKVHLIIHYTDYGPLRLGPRNVEVVGSNPIKALTPVVSLSKKRYHYCLVLSWFQERIRT